VELSESGFPPERFRIVHQEDESITSQSFHDWLEYVLILDEITQQESLEWEEPVLLTDFRDISLTLLKKTACFMESSHWLFKPRHRDNVDL
jgi:hypothetical protein